MWSSVKRTSIPIKETTDNKTGCQSNGEQDGNWVGETQEPEMKIPQLKFQLWI